MLGFFERLVNPFPKDAPKATPDSFLAFVWRCTEGARPFILLMTLCAALIGAFEALLFAMMGRMVDWLTRISPDSLWKEEGTTLVALACLLLFSILVVGLGAIVKHQTLAGVFPMRLRWNFHRLILNQSMTFFQDEFAGKLSAKVMQTALAVRDVCFILCDILVFVSIYFVTLIAIVGSFDVWFLPPFLLWLLLYGLALGWFVPRLARAAKDQADARSLMTGRVTDAYANITTVKLFSHAGREADYAKAAMEEFLTTVHRQMRLVSGMQTANHALNILLILGVAFMALSLWEKGALGVGAIAAATAMALRLNGVAHWIMWEMTMLFEQVGVVQDGLNTLSRQPLVNDRPGAPALTIRESGIVFDHVGFGYNAEKPVLRDFNLKIAPGERIGLVGRSGAGKSTLVNLLLRSYDLTEGRILIDGQNIADVTQDSLRAGVGMVTQDTSLLHRSVRENILYGKPGASQEEMVKAAIQAEADGFIRDLTDPGGRRGYDVHVGERGVKLSGGQRQRIAIARVMLKDAPILLLDEATSALDSEVELAIQGNLNKLMRGKTVIAIAHRLSTIAAMDRLIVMDDGRIVEEGTHRQLLERQGLYAQLWAHQSGGFLPEEIKI